MTCPRCGSALASTTLGPVAYDRCTGCGGGVVPLRSLEAALASLAPTEPPGGWDAPMTPVPDPGGSLACPLCARPMGQGGYMEQPLVRIDRCVSCMLLFADVGELEAMAEQWVRTDRARDERRKTTDAVLGQLKWLVSGPNV
jgi:Zn-finger nucleic acid-binding protein